MDNKDINQLQENLDNLNINIMNKIDEEKEENDISNIIKTKKKNSNNQKSNEKNNEIKDEKNEEDFWNKDNFGILSNLKNLNIDDNSQINRNNEKETPTPSGLKEFKLNIIKIIDDDSKRNIQNKNSNSPFLNDNKVKSFSSFLKKNIDNYNQFNSKKDLEKSIHNNDFFDNLNNNNKNNKKRSIKSNSEKINEKNNLIYSNFNNNYNYYNMGFFINNQKNQLNNENFQNSSQINNNIYNDFNYISNNNNQFLLYNNNSIINNYPNLPYNNFPFNDFSNIYNQNYLSNQNNFQSINYFNQFNQNPFQQNFIKISNINQINEINQILNNIQKDNYNLNINNIQIIPQKKKPKSQLKLNYSTMSINELIKNSDIISKDQNGCRFLQKKIEEQPEIALKILKVCFEKIIEIITDSFGNYLVQKLYNYMSNEQFLQLMALIQIDFYEICINSFGTRAIQKLIDYLDNENLIKTFMNLIKPITKGIIIDINGSHILLKLINLNNTYVNKIIFSEIYDNILIIATHKHGCCVLQKCIEKSNENEKKRIIEYLIKNSKQLICDQCGNYIIQYVISLKNDDFNKQIVNILNEDLEKYSKQKFSSNVVEKILECCSNDICNEIIKILKNNEKIILSILFDQFGNYVLQKALQRSDEKTQQYILQIMAPFLYKLKNYPFGLKLYSKLIITYSYLGGEILTKNEENRNKKENIFSNNCY